MTEPRPIHVFHGNAAVEPDRDDAPAPEPLLAAIQHRYEEAKACIADPARSSHVWADGEEPLPATEAIDLRTVPLPAVPGSAAATAPPRVGPAAPSGRRWWRNLRTALRAQR